MKTEILTLVAATMIGTSPMSAQSKLQVMEVNQILADPDQYRGLTIAVHGVVDKVTPEHQTFTIVDSRPGSSTEGTSAASLTATIRARSQAVFPSAGQEAITIGQVEKNGGNPKFLATQVLTNKTDVKQILAQGSIGRRTEKRPGDNLGRDAQPSRDQ
jgi:hypothetical protein